MKRNKKAYPGNTALYKLILKRVAIYTAVLVLLLAAVCVIGFLTERGSSTAFYGSGNPLSRFARALIPTDTLMLTFIFIWVIGAVIISWRSWAKNGTPVNSSPIHTKSKEQLQKNILRRYRSAFITSAALYTLVLALLAAMIFFVRRSLTWYAEDPLFPVLHFLNHVSPFFAVALWVGGIAFLLYRQWRQSASDVVGLIGSIEEMQSDQDDRIIDVPRGLPEVQPVIQEIYNKKQESRRIAKEAELRRNELIAYLAHDLKTPLTSIIGYLSFMTDQPDMCIEKRAEYCRIALDKAIRLETLIRQFFEISRYNMSDMVLENGQVDLKYLLIQLSDEFYPLLEPQGKRFALNLPGDLQVYGDADKLARVFNNILRNAAAYSYPHTTIQVSANQHDTHVTVTVTNRGNTIPAEQLQNIFRKFFRLDDARGTDTGGAGLGLAIAQEIVLLHGGKITAESSDETTAFTVSLPQKEG